jgi:hypothetical protein
MNIQITILIDVNDHNNTADTIIYSKDMSNTKYSIISANKITNGSPIKLFMYNGRQAIDYISV